MIMVISSMNTQKMNPFVKKIKSVQRKTTLAIPGAMRGTFRDKIYQE